MGPRGATATCGIELHICVYLYACRLISGSAPRSMIDCFRVVARKTMGTETLWPRTIGKDFVGKLLVCVFTICISSSVGEA